MNTSTHCITCITLLHGEWLGVHTWYRLIGPAPVPHSLKQYWMCHGIHALVGMWISDKWFNHVDCHNGPTNLTKLVHWILPGEFYLEMNGFAQLYLWTNKYLSFSHIGLVFLSLFCSRFHYENEIRNLFMWPWVGLWLCFYVCGWTQVMFMSIGLNLEHFSCAVALLEH